ncbi:MAG TPA: hypothetical protein VHJ82_01095, partial [Actinomycetota bacterium]|nr:hypothetical protein [Actinomycetota bacterium]
MSIKKTRDAAAWVTALVVASLLTVLVPPMAQATFPGGNGLIAFTRAGSIWLINPDGTGLRELTSGFDPAFSSDGSKVVFAADVPGVASSELFVINTDGTGRTRLTFNSSPDRDPSWSPDGTKIVFVANRSSESPTPAPNVEQIHVINSDGSGEMAFGFSGEHKRDPEFSPDGTKIAFSSDLSHPPTIFVANADGTQVREVTEGVRLSWAPSGAQLAAESSTPGGGIFRINPDGSGKSSIVDDAGNERSPVWSPSGDAIAFWADYGGSPRLFWGE